MKPTNKTVTSDQFMKEYQQDGPPIGERTIKGAQVPDDVVIDLEKEGACLYQTGKDSWRLIRFPNEKQKSYTFSNTIFAIIMIAIILYLTR